MKESQLKTENPSKIQSNSSRLLRLGTPVVGAIALGSAIFGVNRADAGDCATGDVNGDGVVNHLDLKKVKDEKIDMNGDGEFNKDDLKAIVQDFKDCRKATPTPTITPTVDTATPMATHTAEPKTETTVPFDTPTATSTANRPTWTYTPTETSTPSVEPTSTPEGVFGENLIKNESFEDVDPLDSSRPKDWQNSNVPPFLSSLLWQHDGGYNGASYVEAPLVGRADGSCEGVEWYQDFPLDPSKNYGINYFVSYSKSDSNVDVGSKVIIDFFDVNEQKIEGATITRDHLPNQFDTWEKAATVDLDSSTVPIKAVKAKLTLRSSGSMPTNCVENGIYANVKFDSAFAAQKTS